MDGAMVAAFAEGPVVTGERIAELLLLAFRAMSRIPR